MVMNAFVRDDSYCFLLCFEDFLDIGIGGAAGYNGTVAQVGVDEGVKQ
jgi:hypothetical protein